MIHVCRLQVHPEQSRGKELCIRSGRTQVDMSSWRPVGVCVLGHCTSRQHKRMGTAPKARGCGQRPAKPTASEFLGGHSSQPTPSPSTTLPRALASAPGRGSPPNAPASPASYHTHRNCILPHVPLHPLVPPAVYIPFHAGALPAGRLTTTALVPPPPPASATPRSAPTPSPPCRSRGSQASPSAPASPAAAAAPASLCPPPPSRRRRSPPPTPATAAPPSSAASLYLSFPPPVQALCPRPRASGLGAAASGWALAPAPASPARPHPTPQSRARSPSCRTHQGRDWVSEARQCCRRRRRARACTPSRC